MNDFTLNAEVRSDLGKGASRRLRRARGRALARPRLAAAALDARGRLGAARSGKGEGADVAASEKQRAPVSALTVRDIIDSVG